MENPLQDFVWNQAQLPRESEIGLMTLVAQDVKGFFHAVGTGFVVKAFNATAIALTAGHVLAEIQRLHQPRTYTSHASTLAMFRPSLEPFDMAPGQIFALCRSGDKVVVSAVDGLVYDEQHDVGVLQLRPQKGEESNYPLREMLIGWDFPVAGRMVLIPTYAQLSCANDGTGHFQVAREPIMRVGQVLETFPNGHRLCRGACFETSIPVFSGMSGSPVLLWEPGAPGHVVGVVCSDPDLDGIEKNDRSRAGRSLVAMLPVTEVRHLEGEKRMFNLRITAKSTAGTFHNSEEFLAIPETPPPQQ